MGAALALGGGLGLAASCGVSSFTCESDLGCEGLADGQCEPSGFCSVPDPACPGSGRRYAPHSGMLSGQCVRGGDAATGTATGDDDDALGSTGSSTASTTGASTGPDPSVGTTLPLDDGSSSGWPPDDDSSSEGSTGSDPPPGVACRGPALVEEPFAALPLDPRVWGTYEGQGVTVEILAGELRFVAVASIGGYTGLYTTMPLPTVGRAGAELLAVPPSAAPAEAYVALGESGSSYGFSVSDGGLHTYYYNGMPGGRTSRPYDPVAHRWLRLGFDKDQRSIEWETSPDAVVWQLVDEEAEVDVAFAIESVGLEVGAGAWDGPVSANPLGAFGHAFVCDG